MIIAFISFVLFSLQDLPFKPREDFEIKLDLRLKQRPPGDRTAIHFDETQKEFEKRTSSDMLPYLIINLKLLNVQEEEARVKVTNNLLIHSMRKKVSPGMIIPLELGFTDDVKDRVSPHEYNLTFISAEKKQLSRIRILVEEDGTFLVNDEKRGKL